MTGSEAGGDIPTGSAAPSADEVFDPATEGVVSESEWNPTREFTLFRLWIGRLAAGVVFVSLLVAVLTALVLALLNRPADYIQTVMQSMQPFILPTVAALVGFAVGQQVGRADE
jgi:H+/Cl- antiporter ClcA